MSGFTNKGVHLAGKFGLIWKLVVDAASGEIDRAWRGATVVVEQGSAPAVGDLVDTIVDHGLVLLVGGQSVKFNVSLDGEDHEGELALAIEDPEVG